MIGTSVEASRGYWSRDADSILAELGATRGGLASAEAAARTGRASTRVGGRRSSSLVLLGRQFRNPVVMLLLAAAILSRILGEGVDAAIIIAVVVLSAVLGYVQERGAVRAVDALLASVRVHADVLRDGTEREVAVEEVVPGDVVVLRAGDVVPGDCLVLASNQLHADESALTGESFPAVKQPGVVDGSASVGERSNCVHLGTHVVSGEGTVLVVRTGTDTEFGGVVEHLGHAHVPTAFERGTTAFGLLILRATAILVAGVFAVNMFFGRPVVDSFLFSLALAVGLTPQMLPAIITLTLSRGASFMAQRRVIVKRLDAIEDVGSLEMLLTDKTGTITTGTLALRGAVDVEGLDSPRVLRLARLNSLLQTGFENPIDAAILSASGGPDRVGDESRVRRRGEAPYDFVRKRLSLWFETDDDSMLVTKGAVKEILACCSLVEDGSGGVRSLSEMSERINARFASLSNEGFRVLAVASRTIPRDRTDGDSSLAEEERDMTFVGFLVIEDPPKPGVADAVARLGSLGVETRIVTGDNRHAAAFVARSVGIDSGRVMTGAEVAALDDAALVREIDGVRVFAETAPLEKERIVRACSRSGRTVGYLGDGINDAPSLRVADVGISVDGAVDIAKQTADLVLLEKDLHVLADGISAGRRVFANTLKYVWVTISANFGNMLSLASATLLLPFLPMLPTQILLLNFLSDFPALAIAADRVDEEQLTRPVAWDIRRIRNFMIVFGAVSSVFDIATFVLVHHAWGAGAEVTRTAWFIESTLTELLVMLLLRTRRLFLRSRPGTGLLVATFCVALVTAWLPWSPLAGDLGFRVLGGGVIATVAAVVTAYAATTETVKLRFGRLLSS